MKIHERLEHLGNTPRGRRILRVVQTAFTIGIVLFLVWKLRAVEFQEVLQGLPKSPGFYVLLVALYFLLPTIQILAYRSVWDFRLGAGIKAFIKKRILNKDVLGYSGEVYLFAWAQKHVDLSRRALLESVRDMNIISAAASTLMAAWGTKYTALQEILLSSRSRNSLTRPHLTSSGGVPLMAAE